MRPAAHGRRSRRRADRRRSGPPVPGRRRAAGVALGGRAAGRPGPIALHQLARTDRRLGAGRFPTVAVPGRPWRTSGTDGWLAGFWPGRLWLAYEADGRPALGPPGGGAAGAARRTCRTTPRRTTSASCCRPASAGAPCWRAATATPRSSGARPLRLASRYVPSVGAISGWDGPPGQVTVIVDNLMNLELLFWGARLGGRRQWRDMARAARADRGALAAAAPTAAPSTSSASTRRPAHRSGAAPRRGSPTGRPGRAASPGRCTASPRRTASRATPGCSPRRGGPPGSRWPMRRATACRGGTTTRPAPGGTPRRPRAGVRPARAGPDRPGRRTGGRTGGPPACAPCARWSGRATWRAAPAPGRCCCTAATTPCTTTAA